MQSEDTMSTTDDKRAEYPAWGKLKAQALAESAGEPRP